MARALHAPKSTQRVEHAGKNGWKHPRERQVAARAILTPEQTETKQVERRESVKKCRLITAIKTPYLKNGKFDLQAFDRLVELQANHGVEGIIVGGTTGEGQLMSWDEHIMIIAHAVNNYGNQIKIIGNTGSNSTREALHATEQGFAVGMHAALQINPYYGKTSEKGMITHFEAVMDEGPCIVYNVPGRTAQDITPRVVEKMAGHPNFLGMKECTGNERISNYSAKGITCWSGNDDEAHDARHQAGATGVISVTSNVIPGLFAKLMAEEDGELANKVAPLANWLFREPNPVGINTLMAMTGLVKPVFRLPYVPYSKELREEGVRILNDLGLDNIPGVSEVRAMEDDEFTILSRY